MEHFLTPEAIQKLCRTYGLNPARQYGQNYLIDETPIERMLEEEITQDDTVVEVGPGFGVLTMPLAKKAGQVVAYEIEKKLEPYWTKKLQEFSNITLIWGNVLKQFSPSERYKVIANLPYQITSAVIRLFLESAPQPEVMVCMVQHEVAERICAQPGDLSLLAVSVQYYAAAEYLLKVPKTSFWPSPKVDSALLKITPRHEKRDVAFEADFFKLVKAGFASRRKLLIKNLGPLFKQAGDKDLKMLFGELGLSLTVRAQEVCITVWKSLVAAYRG
jgi:16S rRNA (adenine1518-N6/adenine1519-N6)-dimethyltransferase